MFSSQYIFALSSLLFALNKKRSSLLRATTSQYNYYEFTLLKYSPNSQHQPSNLQPNRRSREDLYLQESSDHR